MIGAGVVAAAVVVAAVDVPVATVAAMEFYCVRLSPDIVENTACGH